MSRHSLKDLPPSLSIFLLKVEKKRQLFPIELLSALDKSKSLWDNCSPIYREYKIVEWTLSDLAGGFYDPLEGLGDIKRCPTTVHDLLRLYTAHMAFWMQMNDDRQRRKALKMCVDGIQRNRSRIMKTKEQQLKDFDEQIKEEIIGRKETTTPLRSIGEESIT